MSLGSYMSLVSLTAIINQDIGPSPSYTWIAPAWTVASGTGMIMAGAVSNVVGRWMLSRIISRVAQNIPTIIVAFAFISLNQAGAVNFFTAVAELLSLKYRGYIIGAINFGTFFWVICSSYIGRRMTVDTGPSWRSIFWMTLVANGAGSLLPLVPMRLLRNWPWTAAVVTSGLGASLYYGLAVVWPSMVSLVYASGDYVTDSLLASLDGAGWLLGEIISGFAAVHIRRIKYQSIMTLGIAGVLLACMATATADSRDRACWLVAFGTFFAGWVEGLSLTTTTLALKDQDELGTGCGFGGSIRFAITTVVSAIYNVIIGTPYRTVFLATIAVTGLGLVATVLLPDVDSLMGERATAKLSRRRNAEGLHATLIGPGIPNPLDGTATEWA
ncbi:hypothetical protein BDV12DRAFT_184888 [Aspergillus spectabilis]